MLAESPTSAVRGCWASAFSGDALGRCVEAAVDVASLRIGVLVQPFVRRARHRPKAVRNQVDGFIENGELVAPLQ